MSQGSSATPDHGQATLARGASIGRYVVLGLVGRGGMGEVYAAYDPELDRKVAVKLLRVKPGAGVSLTEGRQRTLREAQAIARLSHPNVVVVFDVGTFEEKVFIAMEFVEGNTAGFWAQSQTRTWEETLEVYRLAGRGLAAAHEKGLVHRDFKPDNIMVSRDGQVLRPRYHRPRLDRDFQSGPVLLRRHREQTHVRANLRSAAPPHPSHPSRTQVRTVEDACLHMLASCPPASKLGRWLHWLHHAGGNGGHNSPSNPPPPQYFTS